MGGGGGGAVAVPPLTRNNPSEAGVQGTPVDGMQMAQYPNVVPVSRPTLPGWGYVTGSSPTAAQQQQRQQPVDEGRMQSGPTGWKVRSASADGGGTGGGEGSSPQSDGGSAGSASRGSPMQQQQQQQQQSAPGVSSTPAAPITSCSAEEAELLVAAADAGRRTAAARQSVSPPGNRTAAAVASPKNGSDGGGAKSPLSYATVKARGKTDEPSAETSTATSEAGGTSSSSAGRTSCAGVSHSERADVPEKMHINAHVKAEPANGLSGAAETEETTRSPSSKRMRGVGHEEARRRGSADGEDDSNAEGWTPRAGDGGRKAAADEQQSNASDDGSNGIAGDGHDNQHQSSSSGSTRAATTGQCDDGKEMDVEGKIANGADDSVGERGSDATRRHGAGVVRSPSSSVSTELEGQKQALEMAATSKQTGTSPPKMMAHNDGTSCRVSNGTGTPPDKSVSVHE